jgi:hypothetical protein
MADLQERRKQNQDPGLTLKLLGQAFDRTILLDDFEKDRVQLQLMLRQL